WQPPGVSLFSSMHHFIQTALAGLGVQVQLCKTEQKLGEVLCFLHHTPCDLLLGHSKGAGTAQRKQRGAILQHGGILLAQSPFTPRLPGIAELAGRAVTAAELQSALVAVLRAEAGWDFAAGVWAAAEEELITSRIRSRYGSADWNEKR